MALGNIPDGFRAITSVPSITLESGQTGEVGVCLQPIDAVPPVGTDLRFDVTATSSADSSVSLTTTGGITVPAVEGLALAFGPELLATEPGVPVQTTLTLNSIGSGPIADAEITVAPSAGLTVTGIASPVSLAVGETLTWPVTLTPAADTPVNQSLSALVTARFGADLAGDPLEASAAVGVRTTSATAQPVYGAADAALGAGRPNLGRTLSQLGDAINTLVGAPDDLRYRDRLVAIIDQLIGQLSGPALAEIVAALTNARSIIANAPPTGVADALAGLLEALDPLDTFLTTDPAALPFEIEVWPSSITAEPGRPARFTVQLTNTGTETVTYDLDLGDLPAGVSGTLERQSVTLMPGEATSVDGGIPLSVSLTPAPERIDSIEWTVSARPSGSDRAKTAQGLVLARAETLQVLRVAATPGFIDAGGTVQVHAALLSAVNREQSVSVQYRVLDATGSPVFTSAPRAVTTSVADTLTAVDLGTLDTAGFAEGQYRIVTTVTGADGASAATGEGGLFIGIPLLAEFSIDPQLVPPGDAVTQARLHVANRTVIADPEISLIGQVATGSSARSVAVRDDYAYVCGTEDVTIVDISDPRNAAVVGVFAGDLINNLGISYCRIIGDQLVINAQENLNAGSLRSFVFSLDDPLAPALVGTKSLPYRFIRGWYAEDDTVFIPFATLSRFVSLISQKGNFAALDFSDPTNPKLIGSLYGFSGLDGAGKDFLSAAIPASGDHALLGMGNSNGSATSSGGRVLTVDTHDPAAMRVAVTTAVPGTRYVLGLEMVDDTLWVLGINEATWRWPPYYYSSVTLTAYDATDPTALRWIGSTPIGNATTDGVTMESLGNGFIAIAGLRFNNQPALTVIDVNDPGEPHLRSMTVPAALGEIQRRENILFAPTSAGLSFYDIGEVLGLTYSAEVRVPKEAGVQIILDSFNVPPTRIEPSEGHDTLIWERALNRDRAEETLSWTMIAADLSPAEARPVTLASRIGFTTSDDSVGEVVLPAASLVAEQTIGIAPTAQRVDTGETAHYTLHIENPAERAVDYRLTLVGVPAPWVTLPALVSVPAGAALDVPLVITPDWTGGRNTFGFVVSAVTDSGATSEVAAELTLNRSTMGPDADRSAVGVNLALTPVNAPAGQGTTAAFTVRVTNVGDDSGRFDLTVETPAGIGASLGSATVSIPPGTSNHRDVQLLLTPTPGTPPGPVPFTVTATLVADPTIQARDTGTLTVSPLGVQVGLTPAVAAPDEPLRLSVTNTGSVTETFDLTLAGVLAPFATLATDQVTLAAGASAEVAVTLAPIDFALPGELELWGIATARTDTSVLARARATVQVPESSGIAARFEPATVVLNGPGTGASILAVENVGNMEDGFTATITAINGVRTATMTGLRGEPTATVAGFRLPGLASGGILTNAELAAFGSGSVTVGIVSDTDPAVRAEATLNLVTANQPPIADAGGDRQASLGRAVALDGSGSRDPDGLPGPLTYGWTLLAVPDGSALGADAIQPAAGVRASFTPDVVGAYRVRLTVSDGADTATTSVTLTVVDNLPIANAGADRNVLTNGAVTLDGSASFDPLEALLTWAWSLVAAPPDSLLTQADISGADGAAPVFVPDRDGEYRFTLAVTADGRESLPDEVRITAATANVPPNADAGADQRVQVGDLVQLDGGASHDPDQGPSLLNYLWSFARVPAASAVTDADLANAEAAAFTPDAVGEYEVNLQVSDGADSAEDQVVITAESANVPPVAEAGADQRVALGTALTLDGRASHDPDASGPLTFDWTFVSLPPGSALSSADLADAGAAVAGFQPDLVGQYVLRLTVSDGLANAADNVLIDVVAPLVGIPDLYVRAKPGRIDLVWSAVPGAAGYEVWRRTSGAWAPRASLSAMGAPAFADPGLTNGINHCYRVRWRDGSGLWSVPSGELCAIPGGRAGR